MKLIGDAIFVIATPCNRSHDDTILLRTSRLKGGHSYGSLIWNPTMKFAERRKATLHGWHRSFCLHLIAGRATLEHPGRMLSLEPDGCVEGIAFRLPEDSGDQELAAIWLQEMITGAYNPPMAEH